MKRQHYSTSFTVDQSPAEAFRAINDVRAWWSGDITGRTDAKGAEFTYRYQDLHLTTQVVAEFEPDRKVAWRVTASRINFVRDTEEWQDTELVFELGRRQGRTEVRFTHRGLVPQLECYEGCAGAWGFYINESLRQLIATGKGVPNEEPA